MSAIRESQRASARTAGRGGIAVLGAKVYFIVVGLLQQTLLPRMLGLAGYGALSRVFAIANPVNNVIVASSIQGVSRSVAGAQDSGDEMFRRTLRVHVPLAIVVASAFALLAIPLGWFQRATYITEPLQIMAGVVLLYGLYAPLVGALNGRGQFTRQATLDIVFATLRTIGLLGVGYFFQHRWGQGVRGASLGFVMAAALIIPLALRWAGTGKSPGGAGEERGGARVARPDSILHAGTHAGSNAPSRGAYLKQLLPLAALQLATNAVMQIDIILLGRFLSVSAVAAYATTGGKIGDPGVATTAIREGGARIADEWVGVYRACQLFAFLPYQLVMSITQVLFPMLARANAGGDATAVTRLVQRGSRLAALLCGLFAVVVVALPWSLLNFAYGREVATRGASTLSVLALGQAAFTLLGIANTVLASLGRELRAIALTLLGTGAIVVGCTFAAGQAPFGESQLHATAWATSLALAVTLLAATLVVRRTAGGFLPLATAARVGAALALAAFAGQVIPHVGKWMTPLAALSVSAVYLGWLVVTREVTREDGKMLRDLVLRKQSRTSA